MAIDLGAGIMAKLTALFTAIFTDTHTAQAFADDPNGVSEEYGLTSADLSDGVNVSQAALQACQAPGVPANVQTAVQNYASTPHPPAYTVQEVVQQVQQVQVTYDNRTFIDQLVENNTDINVDEDAHDVNIDVDNLTQGDHSVGNTGNDAHVAGATGDRANANTGDHATQSSGDGSITGGGNSTINNPNANSGTFTGQQGQNNAANQSVFGNDNQQANVTGNSGDVLIPFGSGGTNVQGSTVHDANVGVGGNAQNISNNDASQGGAIAGHDAHGSYQDNDTTATDDHSFNDFSITDDHSTFVDQSTHADHGSVAQGGVGNANTAQNVTAEDDDSDGLDGL